MWESVNRRYAVPFENVTWLCELIVRKFKSGTFQCNVPLKSYMETIALSSHYVIPKWQWGDFYNERGIGRAFVPLWLKPILRNWWHQFNSSEKINIGQVAKQTRVSVKLNENNSPKHRNGLTHLAVLHLPLAWDPGVEPALHHDPIFK